MQMNQKEYINPFSQVSEIYAQKLDDASMSGDIVLLERNRQISLRIKRPPSQCLCIEMAACSSIMI